VGTKRAPKNAPSRRQKSLVNGGSGRLFPQKHGFEKVKKLCEEAAFSCKTPRFPARFFRPRRPRRQKIRRNRLIIN
jgi:hypothetical protein